MRFYQANHDLLDKISSVLSISLHADLKIGFDIPGKVKIWNNSTNAMIVTNWPYWVIERDLATMLNAISLG